MLEENTPEVKLSRTKKFFQFPVTRIFIGFVFVALAILPVFIPMVLIGRLISGEAKPPEPWIMLIYLIMTCTVTLSYYLYVRWIEKRPLYELSKPGALKELGVGCSVGFGLITTVILILWILGYYKIIAVSSGLVLLLPLFDGIFTGFFEEIAFRGILFRIMNKSLGSWLAILISSLLFGLAHIGNPNASVYSSIAITLEAGIILSAAYLFTHRLWMVIGMHFAWNFTLGGIFGVAVSGKETEGLFQSQLQGPELFTGGSFGAEMSIITVILCLIIGIFLMWKARKRGNFVQPFWRRAKETKIVNES